MTTFVEIAVNVPRVSGVFHYHLPDHLEGKVRIGHLVVVPFGQQTVQGVVLQTVSTPSVPETKAVLALLDSEPVVTPAQINLAEYLSEHSLTSMALCLGMMLPPGLSQMADTLYRLTEPGEKWAAEQTPLSKAQSRLLDLLRERGPLRGRQITRALPHRKWQASAQALQRRGFLITEAVLQEPSVRPKTERYARLAVSKEVAKSQIDTVGRKGSLALDRRRKIIEYLMQQPGLVAIKRLYQESGGNSGDIHRLIKLGLIDVQESQVWRDPIEELGFVASEPPQLTRAQSDVWEQVGVGIQRSAAGQKIPPYLLFGVTGSGKTEIYLRAVEAVLQAGKQAIVLVPEIALTPQTVQRFVSRFPDQVGLVHSQLSTGERYDTWRRARSGELAVIVGPRSALFTPFANLGLIVVDECHDASYYQSDPQPSYHARNLAVAYARQTGAVCLMGSATPDIVSTYRAARKEWQALSLPERILAHRQAIEEQRVKFPASRYKPHESDAQTIELPPVRVVDMRQELKAGNRSIFSQAMHQALADVLENNQQAILFLNRRGTATYVFCRECGYALKCPRCDTPLTFHASGGKLICHRCNYQRNLPSKCPQCGSRKIRQYGTGTERVEAEVKKLFPQARPLRWDWSTTRTKGAHEAILRKFASHEADVLIGTQMLAKGLDLPLVTLVGVVLAEVGLNLPDYRAGERVFQVLSQVAGRAGRSPLGGQVILQTFQPEDYVIQAAASHSYRDFYRQELGFRRELGYPPFSQLVRLVFRGQESPQVEESAQKVVRKIQEQSDAQTEIIGPVTCFFARVGGNYRWQIILRGPNPVKLIRQIKLKHGKIEVNPTSLL
jgi:primosomal protein N' (replication factor Y) (superfamily II helicase)